MEVSVIIVNYKTAQLCIDCINSVFEKNSETAYEIIVVDNCSGDDSLMKIHQVFGDKVKLIQSPENGGFGYGNNIGMDAATGDFYFLLNSDTLMRNNALDILYGYIKDHPDVGVVGGNLFDVNGKPMHSFLSKMPSLDACKMRAMVRSYFNKNKDNSDCFNFTKNPLEIEGYITGADMMIRKAAIDKVGRFDTEFFMYYEEAELTDRIRKAGYKVVSVPEAEITHFEGASFSGGKFNAFKYRCGKASQFLYYEKVYGKEYPEKIYKLRLRQLRLLRLKPNSHANEKIRILKEEYAKYLERTRG